MKTKSVTVPLWNGRAITLSLWQDLGVLKVGEISVFLGFESSKNFRLSAMERVDTMLFAIGPIGVTYSKLYLREG